MENAFGNNFQGSAVANLITGSIFLLLYIVKDRCSHSSCKGTSKCCRYKCKDVDDDKGGDKESVLQEIKVEMQKLHRKFDEGISQEYNTPLQSIERQGERTPSHRGLVEEKGVIRSV